MKWLLLLALASCAHLRGPAPTCVTRCGIRLLGELPAPVNYLHPKDEPWTCEALQRAEDGMLAMFASATIKATPRTRGIKENACARLNFNLRINPQPKFYDVLGRTVAGSTSCDFMTTIIANYSWHQSALLHETMHQLQGCAAIGFNEHPYWAEDGLEAAEAEWLTAGRASVP